MNLDEIRKLHEQLKNDNEKTGAGENSGNFLKLEMGKNFLRILPGKEEGLQFYTKVMKHTFQDDEGKWNTYICRKTENESCPICDFYFDLWKDHKALNLPKVDGKQTKSKYGNLATQIKGKPRYYMQVVDRRAHDNKEENPVKIFVAAEKLFTELIGAVCDADNIDENDNTILSLENGNDITIEMTKQGEFNNFASKVRPKKGPAGTKSEMAKWMDSLHDLTGLTKIGGYEEGRNMVQNLRASLHTIEDNKPASTESPQDSTEDYLNKLKS